MLRIFADFNNSDQQGRVRLNTVGAREDLDPHRNALKEGMKVILYMPDLEVTGTLVFDEEIWKGIPDWSTTRHIDHEDRATE